MKLVVAHRTVIFFIDECVGSLRRMLISQLIDWFTGIALKWLQFWKETGEVPGCS
jgi:hypothetical protein